MTPEQILAEADRCVKCGYCLPVCPTYKKTADESESPRGRIALVQGLLGGHLAPSNKLQGHLDRCMGCYACQGACPSAVQYGKLLDATRAIQQNNQSNLKRGIKLRLLNLLANKQALGWSIPILRVYQQTGLQGFFRRNNLFPSQVLKRLDGFTPQNIAQPQWDSLYPASVPAIGKVGLFTGCIGSVTDQAAIQASIQVLNKLGYVVIIPKKQACCGAIHRHNGFPEQANQYNQTTVAVFNKLSLTAVVHVASACGTELKQQEKLNHRLMDIVEFLCDRVPATNMEFRKAEITVKLHRPCSQKSTESITQLLGRIPEIQLSPLADNDICCGAAGTYMLTQIAMSQSLLDDKIQHLKSSKPQVLLTSNSGCSLHLSAGIREAKLDIEMMHPIELIARYLL